MQTAYPGGAAQHYALSAGGSLEEQGKEPTATAGEDSKKELVTLLLLLS